MMVIATLFAMLFESDGSKWLGFLFMMSLLAKQRLFFHYVAALE